MIRLQEVTKRRTNHHSTDGPAITQPPPRILDTHRLRCFRDCSRIGCTGPSDVSAGGYQAYFPAACGQRDGTGCHMHTLKNPTGNLPSTGVTIVRQRPVGACLALSKTPHLVWSAKSDSVVVHSGIRAETTHIDAKCPGAIRRVSRSPPISTRSLPTWTVAMFRRPVQVMGDTVSTPRISANPSRNT